MNLIVNALAVLLLLTVLGGCATLTLPERRGRLVKGVQDFTQRLRWKDINGAAGYYEKGPGERFRKMFDDTDDLRIVDVQVGRVDMPQPDRATVSLEYQYYELPSITVQTSKVEQEWVLHHRGKGMPGEWKIASDFPAQP